MRSSSTLVLATFTLSAVCFATGCSGGTASPTPSRVNSDISTAITRGLIYLTSMELLNTGVRHSVVTRFTILTHKNHGVLWGPGGVGKYLNDAGAVATDPHGNVYVADKGPGAIYVYAPGTTTPKKTLNDTGSTPWEVAIGKDGTVYVANYYSPGSKPGNIVAYAPGASNPTKTYTDKNAIQVTGVAVDQSNDVFMSYNGSQYSGTVAVFLKGSTSATETGIAPGYKVGVIALDVNGNLLLTYGPDSGSTNVYAPASPYKLLGGFSLQGTPSGIAFGKSGKTLYVADFQFSEGEIYTYDPSSFAVKQIATLKANFPNVTGVGVWPALPVPI